MSIGLGALTKEIHKHLKVSQVFNSVLSSANIFFSRMHLTLWSNVSRCLWLYPCLLIVHQKWICHLTLHHQILTANLMRQKTLVMAALVVSRQHHPITSGGICPIVR